MNSNLITISSILPQISTHGVDPVKIGKETGCKGKKFFIKQEYDTAKTETADNKAEIAPSKKNENCDEKLSVSQKPLESQAIKKETNKDIPEEGGEKNSSSTEYKSSIESLENQGNENVDSQSASVSSELINQSEVIKSDEVKQFLQTSDNLEELKSLMSEESVGQISLKIYSTEGNKSETNIQEDSQVDNNENTPEQVKLTDVIKEIVKNQSNQAKEIWRVVKENESQLTDTNINNKIRTVLSDIKEADKEFINSNKGKAIINEGKIPALESGSKQDEIKVLELQNKNDAKDAKVTHLVSKNIESNKQSAISQINVEAEKIEKTINSLNDSKKDSTEQKVDITNLQISTGQAKNQIESFSDNKTNSGISQVASNNNTFANEQHVSSISNVKTDNQSQPGISDDASANVGKQILESIHRSMSQENGDKQITVRLNPPELGQVSIKFEEQDKQLTGLLEVSKSQTRSEIEQALPQILRSLSDSGINIKRLEVILTTDEQAKHEATRDDLMFNNQQQQQQNFNNPSRYGGGKDIGGIHEWLTNNIKSVSNTVMEDFLTKEDSINFLV